jgi:hypothetical protein
MNERIIELANEANKDIGYTFKMEEAKQLHELMEKFAELMVKKFDDILLLQYLDCIGNRDEKSAELIEWLRGKTKTYFGVE